MRKRNFGIIGKGRLVTHFLRTLTVGYEESDKGFEMSQLLGLDSLVNDYNDIIGEMIFFNHGYETNDLFIESLSKMYGDYIKGEEKENHLPKLIESGQVTVEKNFNKFISSCEVILDASAGYQPKSLLSYAKQIDSSGDIENQLSLDYTEDFVKYLDEFAKRRDDGRNLMTKTEFAKNWNLSKDILLSMVNLGNDFPVSGRTLWRTPFSIPMMLGRGNQIRTAIDNKAGIILPTYINAVNEPCTTSNILAGICPELAPHLVALTGFDLDRLEQVINDKFAGDKKRLGLEDYRIELDSVFGNHDRDTMVPRIKPSKEEQYEKFQEIIGGSDYQMLSEIVREELGKYYDKYKLDLGEDVNIEVDKNILELVINVIKSYGQGLSISPGPDMKPLHNAYLQKIFGKREGIFLSGKHRFRNGIVIPEDEDINPKTDLESEIFDAMRETNNSINYCVKPISGVNVNVIKYPDQKNTGKTFGLTCYGILGNNMQKISINNIKEGKKGERLNFLPENYYCLTTLEIENVLYLAAGTESGIKIKNMKNYGDCEEDEKNIKISLPGLTVGNQGFKSISLIKDPQLRSNILLATHSNVGAIKINLEELYGNNVVSIDCKDDNYFIFRKEDEDQGSFRVVNNGNDVYFSRGNKVLRYDQENNQLQRIIDLSDKDSNLLITSIDINERGNVYFSAYDQLSSKIFYLDTNTSHCEEIGSVEYFINKIQAVEHQGEEGVLFFGGRSDITFISNNGRINDPVYQIRIDERLYDFRHTKSGLFLANKYGVNYGLMLIENDGRNNEQKHHNLKLGNKEGDRLKSLIIHGVN